MLSLSLPASANSFANIVDCQPYLQPSHMFPREVQRLPHLKGPAHYRDIDTRQEVHKDLQPHIKMCQMIRSEKEAPLGGALLPPRQLTAHQLHNLSQIKIPKARSMPFHQRFPTYHSCRIFPSI